MNNPKAYKTHFKTTKAFDTFVNEAMNLETTLSRSITHGHCETLHLYVDDDTGHIVTWCRQRDKAAFALDAHNDNFYDKIRWQISG